MGTEYQPNLLSGAPGGDTASGTRRSSHTRQLRRALTSHETPVRFLHEHVRTLRFEQRQFARQTWSVCHWGQRKLLVAELDFLMDHWHLLKRHTGKHAVYAGAGPGTHISLLAEAFPDVTFHLFDRTPFRVRRLPNIKLYSEFFTDATARHYRNMPNLLFLSDIRTGDRAKMAPAHFETCVEEDNRQQLTWHRNIRPVASLLKFRPPYRPGPFSYAFGRLYLPVWGRGGTAECRLVPSESHFGPYSREYEDRMFYFNVFTRATAYRKTPFYGKTYCNCFDCTREIMTLSRLKAFGRFTGSIPEMSRYISKVLIGSRISVLEYKNGTRPD